MYYTKQIGELSAKQDLVVFSKEQVSQMAIDNNVSEQEFIEQYKGVVCDNIELKNFNVDSILAVNEAGNTYDVVMIGLDQENFVRFLGSDEPSFGEFLQKHPLFPEIKWDESLDRNQEIFDQIVQEYKKKNLEAS